MIDLHTHILPGMDDGSPDADTSLEMLRMQSAQGVHTVALTSHFYRHKEEPEHFLLRRERAYRTLQRRLAECPEEEQASLPKLLLGAEVAWVPNIADWERLPDFCIGNSRYLLLELPFYKWNNSMFPQIYDLMNVRGVTPVIAHLERYIRDQSEEHIREILSMEVPVQVSSAPLLQLTQRRSVMKMLRSHQAQILASDAHNLTKRPPNLGPGMEVVRKKLGDDAVSRLQYYAEMIVNRQD